MRHKLERWCMPLFPRLRASRAVRVMDRLHKLAPPRVASALLRTWFNGWCTRRRFQGSGSCIFGCAYGKDSVEHYSACSRLHSYGRQQLRPRDPGEPGLRTQCFMLLEASSTYTDELLVRRALLLTAAYKLHCRLRRSPPFTETEVLWRALDQAIKEAAQGHSRAIQVLTTTWLR